VNVWRQILLPHGQRAAKSLAERHRRQFVLCYRKRRGTGCVAEVHKFPGDRGGTRAYFT
jgi:hypothetical protein